MLNKKSDINYYIYNKYIIIIYIYIFAQEKSDRKETILRATRTIER